MENLLQLWNEWEIHLLVLFSLTLQMFLFFAGSLRPRNTNTFVRLSVWFAYLGADFVAIYALGFLSRQQDNATGGREGTHGKNHQLTFFWAPFLLIHLGGQDTITAFAIEDNNLWLRHLLNLTVHVMLASYVFWKSTGWHNLHLLVPGIFLFVSGIIKYGERTYALKCGSLKNTEGLPTRGNEMQPLELHRDDKYATLIGFALRSAPVVRNFFAGCNLVQFMATNVDYMCMFGELEHEMLLKIEIGMIYDDIYSKAMVLRKRICLIFRCLSQTCAVVAFVLFTVSSKHRYSADIVVTYVLFIGGFLVELCAVAVLISSPWTWGWLESRKCHKLAGMCWFLLSNNVERLEKRMLWPNSMGQYNILNYVGLEQSWLSKNLKMLVRVTMNMFGAGKERLLWISKFLDSKTIQVDREIMHIVTQYVVGVHTEFVSNGSAGSRPHHQLWPNLHPVLGKLQLLSMDDFGLVIVFMHSLTEVHLRTYNNPPPGNMDAALVGTCRKLSNYMLYLLVTHPEMLPVTGSVETTLEYFVTKATKYREGGKDDAIILQGTRQLLEDLMDLQAMQPSEEMLREIRDFWLRLLLYAAGKSRGETHAAQLAVGGELLTYTWLLMAHLEMGDSWPQKIELGDATAGTMMSSIAYVFPKKSDHHT